MDSIKQQIIDAIVTRAERIKGGSYNTSFNVVIQDKRIQTDLLPMISVFSELQDVPEESMYFADHYLLPISIQASSAFGIDDSPQKIGNKMEADLLECFFGNEITFSFTDGDSPDEAALFGQIGNGQYTIGDIITVAGAWASGTAQGAIAAIRFDEDDLITTGITHNIGSPTLGTLYADGPLQRTSIQDTIFGALKIENYQRISSGFDEYPDIDDNIVSVYLNIEIQYKTKGGNPYEQ